MSTLKNKPIEQIPQTLNDIRLKLNDIQDTKLALEILTDIEQLETFTRLQAEAIEDAQKQADEIRQVNNALLIRSTALNSVLPPSTAVNYNSIDPTQSIIDKI